MPDAEHDVERADAEREAPPLTPRHSHRSHSHLSQPTSPHSTRHAPAAAAADERTPLLRSGSSTFSLHIPPRPRPKRRRSQRKRAPPIYLFPAIFLLLLCILAGVAAWDLSYGHCRIEWICSLLGEKETYDEVWGRNTGAYAPWRSRGGGKKQALPTGCVVDQVSILHRHTGRYPTHNAGHLLRATLDKIANRLNRVPSNRPEFAFLARADTTLDGWRFGELTDQGRRAAWESGQSFVGRYPGLELFVRTTDQARVEESSRFWLEGYGGRAFNSSAPRANVTIPEGKHENNTLSVHSCTVFEELHPPAGKKQYSSIIKQLRPAAERLNHILSPQPVLDEHDVMRLASMCGFDTTASAADGGWSPWCRFLTRDEWDIAGYAAEVERWYRVGEGGRYGRIMGAGWVNELLARLGDTVPRDATTVNHTLAADPATFPRGGHRMFVDFTHDNEMIEIMSAVGMRKMRRRLPTKSLPDDLDKRRFTLAYLVPFGARWAFERIVCGEGDDAWDYNAALDPALDADPSATSNTTASSYPTKRPKPRPKKPEKPEKPEKRKTYVRVLINDKPTHIDHMACRSSEHYEHHMCSLPAFVDSQIWSREDVDWADCVK